jgi:hypothetical protein
MNEALRTRLPAAVGLFLLVGLSACGSSAPLASPSAQLASGFCMANGASGRPTKQSCVYVLSDGERFRCPAQLGGPPLSEALRRARCVKLRSLELSSAQRSVIGSIAAARRCLGAARLVAHGSAVLPGSASSPDGEIVISSAHPTFVAFYTSAAKASRLEPAVRLNLKHSRGMVERRGAVTIVWSAAPASRLRRVVETCVFR